MKTSILATRIVWVLLAITVGTSLVGSSAEAWPGRRAWVKGKMWQNLNTAPIPNNIRVTGIDLGLLCAYYKGSCDDKKFPDAGVFGMTYRGISMTALKWYLCDTPRYTYRWIGIGCISATTASGVCYWYRDDHSVNVAPPFAGVAFNSPISLCGMNVDSLFAQPIVYENVRYALTTTRPSMDVNPDVLRWMPTDVTAPVTVQPNASVIVGGLPSDAVIGRQSVLLHGTIRGSYAPTDTVGWHLTSNHTSEFVIAIYDTLAPPVDIDDRRGENRLFLGDFQPHPIVDVSTLRFALPGTEPVQLIVYDLAGRRVRTLVDGPLGIGQHQTSWNGLDDRGAHVAKGLYFVRMTNHLETATRRVLVLR